MEKLLDAYRRGYNDCCKVFIGMPMLDIALDEIEVGVEKYRIELSAQEPATASDGGSLGVCKKCGGAGNIKYYHDAGDHFGAGVAPNSEWRVKPCDACRKS